MKKIYIAGPLFSEHERNFLVEIVEKLAKVLKLDAHRDFFLPHRDVRKVGDHGERREKVFSSDLKFLDEVKVVVALLDGPDVDSGTAVELGYAFAQNKEIIGLLTDWRCWDSKGLKKINNMIWGVCGKGKRIFKEMNEDFFEQIKKCLLG